MWIFAQQRDSMMALELSSFGVTCRAEYLAVLTNGKEINAQIAHAVTDSIEGII